MMGLKIKIFLVIGSAMVFSSPAAAEELTVKLTSLGLSHPSPFSPQLYLQLTNESFLSVDLLDKIKTSQLLLDGHPVTRLDQPFRGPAGLPPKGSWEGCLSLADFMPEPPVPGSHRLQLKIGNTLSPSITLKTFAPSPPAIEVSKRLEQVNALKEVLTPGLLRSCVENWLAEPDGGPQSPNSIHYYVDPGVKVLVSYQQAQPEPRVKGRIRIYAENRILD